MGAHGGHFLFTPPQWFIQPPLLVIVSPYAPTMMLHVIKGLETNIKWLVAWKPIPQHWPAYGVSVSIGTKSLKKLQDKVLHQLTHPLPSEWYFDPCSANLQWREADDHSQPSGPTQIEWLMDSCVHLARGLYDFIKLNLLLDFRSKT